MPFFDEIPKNLALIIADFLSRKNTKSSFEKDAGGKEVTQYYEEIKQYDSAQLMKEASEDLDFTKLMVSLQFDEQLNNSQIVELAKIHTHTEFVLSTESLVSKLSPYELLQVASSSQEVCNIFSNHKDLEQKIKDGLTEIHLKNIEEANTMINQWINFEIEAKKNDPSSSDIIGTELKQYSW